LKIKCPKCGWKQVVDDEMWKFSITPYEMYPGVVMHPHPHTCGSGKCPSHTEMVPDFDKEDYNQDFDSMSY